MRHWSRHSPGAARATDVPPQRKRADAPVRQVAQRAPRQKPPTGKAAPRQDEIDLAVSFYEHGQDDDAAAQARRLIAAYPRHNLGWKVLGATLDRQGRHDDACAAFEHAVALDPRDAAAHDALGDAHRGAGRAEAAVAAHRRAIAIDPGFAAAHFNLGNALQASGHPDEAEAGYRRALALSPAFADAHFNLGVLQKERGRPHDARDSFRAAVEADPRSAEAWSNLGALEQEAGRPHDAEPCLRRALDLAPDAVEALHNLGIVLRETGRLTQSEAVARRCIGLAPRHVSGLTSLGHTLKDLGRAEEAARTYRQALAVDPQSRDAQSALLFLLNFLDPPAALCLDEARRYGRMLAQASPAPVRADRAAPAAARALRVGLVSGDLRDHPVGHFLESTLAALDPGAIAIHAYPTQAREDALTARLRRHCAAWRPLHGLDDAQAAAAIRADGIEVLVDLSGHTAHHRLALFALRPAPVQATWLGYFASTGVPQIDYIIADPLSLPAEDEDRHTEAVWRLPDTRMCFTPPRAAPEVAALPALREARPTFGCFGSLAKIGDDVIATWAAVLSRTDGLLLLKSHQYADPAVREALGRRFAAAGVDPRCLTIEPPEPRERYLAAYHRVDIGLDTFPFTGGTTTAESLWMGVPVLTLRGRGMIARQGAALLAAAGLDDWIATDREDFVRRACALAADRPALARLRAGLRERVKASPLFDAGRFAAHLLAAFEGMWRARGAAGDA